MLQSTKESALGARILQIRASETMDPGYDHRPYLIWLVFAVLAANIALKWHRLCGNNISFESPTIPFRMISGSQVNGRTCSENIRSLYIPEFGQRGMAARWELGTSWYVAEKLRRARPCVAAWPALRSFRPPA